MGINLADVKPCMPVVKVTFLLIAIQSLLEWKRCKYKIEEDMLRTRGVLVLDGGSEKFGAGFQQILISFTKLHMNIDASPMSH